jgi:hypothetical protein
MRLLSLSFKVATKIGNHTVRVVAPRSEAAKAGSVVRWRLARVETPDPRARAAGVAPKPTVKSLPNDGIIKLDSETTLTGIPPEAFAYRLGNRSGLDWILDQYKEKAPKDPTIREKFNTYRFADYKEKVIDLIARVTRVSVETMAITNAMKEAKR